ncbi:MAG: sialidase family protein [Chitinophagaceae bacterium]
MQKLSCSVIISFLFTFIFLPHISIAQQPRISQFEKAELCDLLIDKAGVYHAVYQEKPDFGKPVFIYYTASSNRGATWTKPITLSNDNSGNGSGYPRILQDGSGRIYAIWKRYGTSDAKYPQQEPYLDGPGGKDPGTVFYKVLNGGAWSNQVQINELEAGQVSWFATVSPQGLVYVFWTQASEESIKNNRQVWYYCDYMRFAPLNGTSVGAITDLSKPSPPVSEGGFPVEKRGGMNLQGYIDKDNLPHIIYEDEPDGIRRIKYFDGKTQTVVYTYQGYIKRNTFHDPAHLLTDEAGNDHLILLPSDANLEDQQIWDVNLATKKTDVLLHLPASVGSITGMQASQGPNGAMAVTFEMYRRLANTEAYGLFYEKGKWQKTGLTNNAAKDKFMSKDFIGVGGYLTNITTSTTYNSQYTSVAYDAKGRKSMIMTIAAHWLSSAYSQDSPSVVFVPLDK